MSHSQQTPVGISQNEKDPNKSERSPLFALIAAQSSGISSEQTDEDPDPQEVKHIYVGPRRSWAHISFLVISTASMSSLTFMALSQGLTAATVPLEPIQVILRVHILIFCLTSIVAELQYKTLLKYLPALENWVYRGFLYSYTGLIGVEESHSVRVSPDTAMANFISVLVKMPSYAMVAMGCLYMLLGMCCCNRVRQGIEDRHEKLLIKEISRQREEGIIA